MTEHVGDQNSCCQRCQHRTNQNNGNQNGLLGRRNSRCSSSRSGIHRVYCCRYFIGNNEPLMRRRTFSDTCCGGWREALAELYAEAFWAITGGLAGALDVVGRIGLRHRRGRSSSARAGMPYPKCLAQYRPTMS
jgi:hypothetical protein